MTITMTVSGRVQGVGFRYLTKMVADSLAITGSVKNLSNGDVYIEASGNPENMMSFIEQIKKSPTPAGRVDHCDIDFDVSLKKYTDFSVSY